MEETGRNYHGESRSYDELEQELANQKAKAEVALGWAKEILGEIGKLFKEVERACSLLEDEQEVNP